VEPEPKKKSAASEPQSLSSVTVKLPNNYNFASLMRDVLKYILVSIAIFLLVSALTGRSFIDVILSVINPPTVASVTSTQTIVSRIQPLGQLVSISVQLAKADIYVSVQQGTLNACGFGASYVAHGTIEAGIDLTAITEDSIRYDALGDTYTLTLPPAQLTSCRIDYIDQYDNTTTACAVDFDAARQIANYQTLVEFRDDAIAEDILLRAEQEARTTLISFIEGLTQSRVEIVLSETAVAAFPDSCEPEPPQRWAQNADTGIWVRQ
jgi:hypothetical protein